MIPYYLFSVIRTFIVVIQYNSVNHFTKYVRDLIYRGAPKGAGYGGLWFLSCLFFMNIIFALLRKIKNKPLILVISIVIFYLRVYYIPLWNPNIFNSHWFYNIDSVFYYLPFFIIGWITFPLINDLRGKSNNQKSLKIILVLLWIIAGIYNGYLFFGTDLLLSVSQSQYYTLLLLIIQPLICTFFYIGVSMILEKVVLFQNFGKSSLYLCGNEDIAKWLIESGVGLFGINITIVNPLTAWIYSFILICLIYKYFIPIQSKILKIINNKIFRVGLKTG